MVSSIFPPAFRDARNPKLEFKMKLKIFNELFLGLSQVLKTSHESETHDDLLMSLK